MILEVDWLGKMAFKGRGPSGHEVLMDASIEHGGDEKGIRPIELLPIAAGGCSGMDVVNILSKMRIDLKGLKIKIEAGRREDYPKAYTRMKLIYIFKGMDLPLEKLKRAVELSMEKYCSVLATLKGTVDIEYEIEREEE
ncbi:MAG: OsmC family protein [Synergistetes bacterium]|nr:OsmC family protein [Synergistota bacterium]